MILNEESVQVKGQAWSVCDGPMWGDFGHFWSYVLRASGEVLEWQEPSITTPHSRSSAALDDPGPPGENGTDEPGDGDRSLDDVERVERTRPTVGSRT